MSLIRFAMRNASGNSARSWIVFFCAALMAGFVIASTLVIRGANDSLRLALDQGTCRIYQVGRESYIGFCQRENLPTPPGSENSNQVIITLVTPDVDGWYQCLTERGVEFDQAPVANSTYNIYHCFLRDPNGYLVEIQRFLHLF